MVERHQRMSQDLCKFLHKNNEKGIGIKGLEDEVENKFSDKKTDDKPHMEKSASTEETDIEYIIQIT